MKVWPLHFNIILLLLGFVLGCQTPKEKKELSAVRLHIEVNPDALGTSMAVPVYRAAPVKVNVDNSPFVDERDLTRAEVIEWMGGFAIQLEFNYHGKLMLENTTRIHPSKRIGVLAEFGQTRWLAAPLIARAITDGKLVFTPDATREEAERFVRGLNAVAAEVKANTFESTIK